MFLTKLNEVFRSISDSKKSFLADRMNFVNTGIAGLLNIIHWLVLYIKIKPNEPNVLLHYNVIYGTDFVGNSIYIYWIPLLALILLTINLSLASYFYNREKLASYFINIASVPIQIVFFIATIVLILVNE